MESGVHPTRETQYKGEKPPHGWHIPTQDSPHIPEVREALGAQAQAQTTLARMPTWPTGSPRHRPMRGRTDPITHRGCSASPGDPSPAWMRPGGPFPALGAEGGTALRYPTGSEPARSQRERSRAAPRACSPCSGGAACPPGAAAASPSVGPKPSSFSMPAISLSCWARKAAAGSSSAPAPSDEEKKPKSSAMTGPPAPLPVRLRGSAGLGPTAPGRSCRCHCGGGRGSRADITPGRARGRVPPPASRSGRGEPVLPACLPRGSTGRTDPSGGRS